MLRGAIKDSRGILFLLLWSPSDSRALHQGEEGVRPFRPRLSFDYQCIKVRIIGKSVLNDPRPQGFKRRFHYHPVHEGGHLRIAASDSECKAFSAGKARFEEVLALMTGIIRAAIFFTEAAHPLIQFLQACRGLRLQQSITSSVV